MSAILEYNLTNDSFVKNQILNNNNLLGSNKKRIVYMSSEWFIDTDLTVLSYLGLYYDLFWFYQTSISRPRFPIEKLKRYASEYNINLIIINSSPYKYQDPRNYFYFKKIAKLAILPHPDLVVKIGVNIFFHFAFSRLFDKYKTIYGIHDCIMHTGQRGRMLLQLASDYIIKKNISFIVYSKSQLSIFKKRFKNKDVKLVSMSAKDFGTSELSAPKYADEIRLLFFGQIHSYKGLDILIEELEKLYDNGINKIKLTICGKGRFWNHCKELIKHPNQYNLKIRFIENSEIPDLMCSHHFLVLPYRDATQSGPIMIAANYGLPILCPNLESFTSIYDDKSAIIYKQGDLKEGLSQALSLDESTYANLKRNASHLAAIFSPDKISNNYIEVLNNIIKRT